MDGTSSGVILGIILKQKVVTLTKSGHKCKIIIYANISY